MQHATFKGTGFFPFGKEGKEGGGRAALQLQQFTSAIMSLRSGLYIRLSYIGHVFLYVRNKLRVR